MSSDSIQVLQDNCPHRTYLITYSQLDHKKFPTRWSFGAAVVQAFGATNVDYFVASKEPHELSGYHYHVAVRLNKAMRWNTAKKYLKDIYCITVNFSVSSDMYIGAYRYATKSDKEAFVGNVLTRHPNLEMISSTYSRAIMANNTYCQNRQQAASQAGPSCNKKAKPERLKKGDVAMFIVENKINTELDLMSSATERRNLGDRVLYDYLISLRRVSRQELVQDAWRFENAKQIIVDENINRIEKLQEHAEKPCLCGGRWLDCAKDLLVKNNIGYDDFSQALYNSLEKGRGKHLNVLLYGPGDCGKTFLLAPVFDLLPNVFSNPASSTFGWMGVEKSNLIFLNDLRWAPRGPQTGGNIDWSDFLNLLEGLKVTLPAPMNTHSSHLEVAKRMPIFATSVAEVRYWVRDINEPQTERHHLENRMMKPRWNPFKFSYQIAEEDKIQVPKCTTCFAKFVLKK